MLVYPTAVIYYREGVFVLYTMGISHCCKLNYKPNVIMNHPIAVITMSYLVFA